MKQAVLDVTTNYELLQRLHNMMAEIMVHAGSDLKDKPPTLNVTLTPSAVIALHGIARDLCLNWDRIICNSAPPHAGAPKIP